MCTGAPTPQTLAGTTQRIPYLILNRFDDQSALDEQSQLYRIGAQGLLPSSTPGQACISVSASEQVWASAAPVGCNTNRIPQPVTSTLCGVYSLFDTTAPAACQSVPNVDTLSSSYQPDLDLTDQDDYTAYTGTGRRLITVPIVDALNAGGAMTVLGFRQFLVEPTQGLAANDPGDTNGRFSALYTGVVAPVKQGRYIRPREGGAASMKEENRRGSAILEAAMFIPVITLLLVGMVQIAKITYVYYVVNKTLYSLAKYVSTQQNVNFCDDGDPTVAAAKSFALTGTTDNSATPLVPNLTADMILVRIERYDPTSQTLADCDCSSTGCDIANGGQRPDFIVVSIPDGYQVQPRIPFLTLDAIPLKPEVRVPYGGT
jgi:hypothetical protein